MCVFFFKQKTAYEIYYGLVGSEMCIRDSTQAEPVWFCRAQGAVALAGRGSQFWFVCDRRCACLLYTSDAADERSSVDLGGRRIIKKKKREERESLNL